jgi:hypothetical protein
MALLSFSRLGLAKQGSHVGNDDDMEFSYEGSRLKVALSNEHREDGNRTKQRVTLDMMIRCGVTCSAYWSVCPWLCTDDCWTFKSEMSPATKAATLHTDNGSHSIPGQVRSCGLCCGWSGTEVGFLRYFGFPCQFWSQRMLHRYISSQVGSVSPHSMNYNINKKFWEELMALFPWIRHGPLRKQLLQFFIAVGTFLPIRGYTNR